MGLAVTRSGCFLLWTLCIFFIFCVKTASLFKPKLSIAGSGSKSIFPFTRLKRLSQMSHEQNMDGRNILLGFLLQAKQFPSMPPDVVRRLLYFGRPPCVSNSVSPSPVQSQRSSVKRKVNFSMDAKTAWVKFQNKIRLFPSRFCLQFWDHQHPWRIPINGLLF